MFRADNLLKINRLSVLFHQIVNKNSGGGRAMYKSLKQIADRDSFPFVVMAFLLVIFHIPLNTNFGDDLMGRAIWEEGRTLQYIAEYWSAWGSRVLIALFLITSSGLPQIFWKIANISVMVLAAVCVSKFFVYDTHCGHSNDYNSRDPADGGGRRRSCNIIVASLFMMYNLYEMSSTGWVASTTNYMWPATACLYVLLSIKRALRPEKFKKYEYPLIIAALIFAANQEQVCAVLLLIYLYYICRAAYYNLVRRQKRHFSRFVLLQFFICLASLTFILLSPGNRMRSVAEAARWFPDHAALTFFEKALIGFSSTLNYFVMTPNVLFLVLSLLLAAGIFVKYKNPWARAASVTPLLVNIAAFAYVFFDYFMVDGTFTLRNPRDIFQLYGLLAIHTKDAAGGEYIYFPNVLCSAVLYSAMICSFTACLYLFFRGADNFFFPFGVLFLGIASRAMMGLSPTVFVSSYRTYLFLNLSFIIAAVIIYQNIFAIAKPKTIYYINAFMVIIALANFLALPVGYQIVKPFFGRP
jgi:hypothetical protein